MKNAVHIFPGVVVGILLLFFVLTGCDEDVTAVRGTDQPFSLYGVLSPQFDSQWVRVYPIEGRLEPGTTEPLDAQFASTDLQNGERHVWNDSLVEDLFNQKGHAFWAPFRAEYEHTYTLEVRRSDDATSSVEITVPPLTKITPQDPTVIASSVQLPVHVGARAPRLNKIEVSYAVSFIPAGERRSEGEDVVIAYDGRERKTEEAWIIPIDMSGDFKDVSNIVTQRIGSPIDREFGLLLLSIAVRLIVANEEWAPPGGTFDPAVLVQPGTMSNVENGFGFVGAGYRLEKRWVPAAEAITAAGFRAQ